jgi:hypothetical protein
MFGIKVLASILLTAIYTGYYTNRETADIFKYFDDSLYMFKAIKTNPVDYFKMLFAVDNDSLYFDSKYYNDMTHWVRPYTDNLFSDSHVIIRFNAFVRLFSFGHFQVHNIFINFVSLLGLTALYKAFKPYVLKKEKALIYILALLPSLLFWCSGLLKEGIILFALGFFLLHFFKLYKSFNIKSLIIIMVCLILILYTKFYLIIALSIPLLGYTLNSFLKKHNIIGYLIASAVLLVIGLILPTFVPEWDVIYQICSKQQTFSRFISVVQNNSGFLLPELENGFDILINIPNALNNTLIRPYPWEAKSAFVLLSFFENLLIITLITITFLYRTKNKYSNIIWFNIMFSFCLLTLIGLTTPVFGAIARYKIPAILFLLIALLIMVDIEKLKHKFKFLSKIL